MKAKSTKKHELRWLFLREFTKQLIIDSTPIKIEEEIEIHQEEIKIKKPIVKKQMFASPRTKFEANVFPTPKMAPIYAQTKPLPGYTDLGKLNVFISDPRISQIECYGPNKEITVKISNASQKTRIKLTKEEMDKILKDFSEQTRIPLMKGVFKAALGNITLTAVISDFVDTRFTIQKRRSFQQRF